MEFTNQAKEDIVQYIQNKREEIMRKFCLNNQTFELVLNWFTKEKILHDENDNTPVLIIKDPSKPDNRKNMEWVSIRLADAIKYAREYEVQQ
ncbi:MAG: hypothetical protein CMG64_04320 [Candidatus Marinimicrobia bacterium]|nr:hypothetical protein [Candidatus Neomarinimicrobiota bacterium]